MTYQDYLKFITEQLMIRIGRTEEDKAIEKKNKASHTISNKWFGLFPFSWKILTKR